jgi:acyl dehydratase
MSTDTARAPVRRPTVIEGVDGLRERVGSDLGVSDWLTVDQESVDTFARLTGDEQWIHVDPKQAAEGPFGVTVAHGFLTLGRSTGLLWSVAVVDRVGVILNYGLNKVRFPAPVKVGSRLRMHVFLADVTEVKNGVEAVYRLTYEVEGETKPPCVADLVFRYYPEDVPSTVDLRSRPAEHRGDANVLT